MDSAVQTQPICLHRGDWITELSVNVSDVLT